MGFRVIDPEKWDRAEKYKYFTTAENCVISLTCDIDVTDLVALCKTNSLKFYTAFICVVSRVINSDEHYRMGKRDDGSIVVYDTVNPLFTDFVPEGETFNNLTAEYCENAKELYERITKVREKYRGVEIMFPAEATENLFSITALPWVHYSSMELHYSNSGIMLSPIVAWGKYVKKEGRLMLPVTMRVHHAVCDGLHAARFFNRIEETMPEIARELIR